MRGETITARAALAGRGSHPGGVREDSPPRTSVCHRQRSVEIVRKLARIEPDARIASILNRNQRLTAHGEIWTAMRICSLRSRHAFRSTVRGNGRPAAKCLSVEWAIFSASHRPLSCGDFG